MAEERTLTPNYHWPLPLPQGNQIVEIKQIGDTISEIDATFKTFVDAYNEHKHKFGDIEQTPTTLEGYGIKDAMTSAQVESAITESGSSLSQSFTQALSNLTDTIGKALGLRVRVDDAQEFTLAQKKRARDNIEAVGVVDKGAAGGVAPLGADSKIAGVYLPALTTTGTVGAAVAGANGQQSIADGDSLTGVLAGSGTLVRWTWGNIVTWLRSIFYVKTEVNNIIAGNMGGRAYPRRSDGGALNIIWSGQSGMPSWVLGGSDGANVYAYNPANFSVNYANSANWANGATYADRLGAGGWTLADVQGQLNWRVTDTRFAGYITRAAAGTANLFQEFDSGYVCTGYRFQSISGQGAVTGLSTRQLQIHIPNVGWRAFGGW
ncbi:hypothetical protein [Brucella sp.]|uniref:hypothetical protein n=1 Tax=Brucella sp. TaxID=52132 RepID=UPI0028AF1997|nr:hypothetical protein [Brucella sp.]